MARRTVLTCRAQRLGYRGPFRRREPSPATHARTSPAARGLRSSRYSPAPGPGPTSSIVVPTFDLRANNDYQKLEINQLPKKEADIIREELVCFHSRRHFTEDVLGIDISLIWNNRCDENLTAVTITIVTTIITTGL